MSRKQNLDKRVMSIAGTIYLWQYSREEIQNALYHFCRDNDFVLHYYYIYHDDESDKLHFHYVLRLNRAIRLLTMLNNFETFFKNQLGNAFDRDQVSVEGLTDLNAYLRYFIHLEYDDKKPYRPCDIYSDETLSMIEGYINSEGYELTAERLFAYIINSETLDDLMLKMGLKAFHKYRYEIKELWDSRGGLKARHPELVSDANDLPF